MPNSAHSSDESEFVAEEIEEDFDDDREIRGDPEELRQERLELIQLPSHMQRPFSKRPLSIQEQLELEKINSRKRGRYQQLSIVIKTKEDGSQTFASLSKAQAYSGISRGDISAICDAGGGMVKKKQGDYYVCYKRDDNTELPEETRKPSGLPANLERFDVSTLKPLTRLEKQNQSSDYKIELICKLTGEVHVCFANSVYAAQALNVKPTVVHKACRSFGGDPSKLDDDLPFCQLRLVESSSAYEYSAHPRDFFSCEESHEERLQRWAKLQRTTASYQKPPGANLIGGIEEKLSSETAEVFEAPAKNRKVTAKDQVAAKEQVVEGPRKVKRPVVLHEYKKKEIITFLKGATIFPEHESICVACQRCESAVVLEPCHHQILCRHCASNWCPKFCPLCSTPIERRVGPKKTLWVQPHVNSTYTLF
jgi:nicotinamidase-related amidase